MLDEINSFADVRLIVVGQHVYTFEFSHIQQHAARDNRRHLGNTEVDLAL